MDYTSTTSIRLCIASNPKSEDAGIRREKPKIYISLFLTNKRKIIILRKM